MDALRLLADERRLEEHLRAAEALVADHDHVAVRKLVRLLQGRGLSSRLHLRVEVQGDVGQLLLDVANNLTLGSGGEGVATLGQDLHQVVSEIATGKVQTHDSVGKGIALVDGHGVGHSIA